MVRISDYSSCHSFIEQFQKVTSKKSKHYIYNMNSGKYSTIDYKGQKNLNTESIAETGQACLEFLKKDDCITEKTALSSIPKAKLPDGIANVSTDLENKFLKAQRTRLYLEERISQLTNLENALNDYADRVEKVVTSRWSYRLFCRVIFWICGYDTKPEQIVKISNQAKSAINLLKINKASAVSQEDLCKFDLESKKIQNNNKKTNIDKPDLQKPAHDAQDDPDSKQKKLNEWERTLKEIYDETRVFDAIKQTKRKYDMESYFTGFNSTLRSLTELQTTLRKDPDSHLFFIKINAIKDKINVAINNRKLEIGEEEIQEQNARKKEAERVENERKKKEYDTEYEGFVGLVKFDEELEKVSTANILSGDSLSASLIKIINEKYMWGIGLYRNVIKDALIAKVKETWKQRKAVIEKDPTIQSPKDLKNAIREKMKSMYLPTLKYDLCFSPFDANTKNKAEEIKERLEELLEITKHFPNNIYLDQVALEIQEAIKEINDAKANKQSPPTPPPKTHFNEFPENRVPPTPMFDPYKGICETLKSYDLDKIQSEIFANELFNKYTKLLIEIRDAKKGKTLEIILKLLDIKELPSEYKLYKKAFIKVIKPAHPDLVEDQNSKEYKAADTITKALNNINDKIIEIKYPNHVNKNAPD